ncbi:MAG: hypothetical protein JSS40_03540 [Proteobacteria bacterium]|nr:hypothetical protein [Pseudomonadota bacterium]
MQARLIPGSRGWRWLADGWNLFRASPVMWLVLVSAYWMLMTVVSVLPYVGLVAALVLVPGFSVAFMAASRATGRGEPLALPLIFAGFRVNARAQLLLGAVYLVSMVLVLASSTLADDGALARWMVTGARPTNEVLQSDGFLLALAISATLYMPVMMLMWFAPTLVAWHAMPVAKALFYSLFACLMNWRAFTVYGAASALVLIVLPFFVLILLLLASGGTLRPAVMAILFPLVFSLMPVMFASFYASYRDIFSEGKEPGGEPPG